MDIWAAQIGLDWWNKNVTQLDGKGIGMDLGGVGGTMWRWPKFIVQKSQCNNAFWKKNINHKYKDLQSVVTLKENKF